MRTRILLIAACISIVVAAPAWPQTAQTETPAAATSPTLTASGKVSETTGTTLTIITEYGDRMSFSITDPTMLPADLTPSQTVRVTYQREGDGTYRLMSLTPVAATPATTPADPPQSAGENASRNESPIGDASMPRTAGLLPILALAGLVALFLGFGIRAFTRSHHKSA